MITRVNIFGTEYGFCRSAKANYEDKYNRIVKLALQFEELSEDPLVLYDLRIADDVVVPHQQLARMPNVLKRSGGVTTSGGKRKQMTTSAAELASLLDDDTLMEAILREKLDGRELARALDVNRALTDKVTSKLRANAARAASLAEAAE